MEMVGQRVALFVALLAMGGLVIGNLARAGASPMPESLAVTTSSGPGEHEVGYQLRIQSGPEGTAFGVEYELPSWPTTEPISGSPLEIASIDLFGPGSIRPAPGLVPLPFLPIENGCVRRFNTLVGSRFWVEVPANNASMVDLQVEGRYPAWPGTRYGISFSTFAVDDKLAPLSDLADINVTRFMPMGTHIQIRAKGRLRNGFTPQLSGKTTPPFRMAQIRLRAVERSRSGKVGLDDWADPAPRAVSLGAVRTDRQGHFSVPPRPLDSEGRYAVIARSEARGARSADWNCGAFFSYGSFLSRPR